MGTECQTGHAESKQNAHHWVIDARNFGVCKKCGAKKQFVLERCSWRKAAGASNKSEAVQATTGLCYLLPSARHNR